MKETPIQKAWRTRRRKTDAEILESIKVMNVSLEEAVESVLYSDLHDYEDLAELRDIIGMDNLIKIIHQFEGEHFTIPRAEAIWYAYQRKLIYRCLRKKYDRYVIRELARFFAIGEGNVRTIYQTEKKRRAFKNTRTTKLMRSAIKEIIARSEMDRNLYPPYP